MFEKFLSGNIERFRQRYEGTYGFYRDPKRQGKLLVKLTEISPQRCTFMDANRLTYYVAPDHPQDVGFEFLPPDSKWYNTPDGAVFAQRLARRQWQRGVTGQTLDVGLLKKGLLHPCRVDFETLSKIYETPIPPKDAIKSLPKLSVAVSGQFALGDDNSVWVLRERIGDYKQESSSKFTMTLKEPALWRTELTDAFTAMGCSITVS